MSERNKNVVGVLQPEELLTCIQALEALEKEMQSMVELTLDASPDETWKEWQALAVNARSALTTLRTIAANAATINTNPHTAYTIRWEGSL